MITKGGNSQTETKKRMFYPDLDMAGKHYLVQEQNELGYPIGNARQYTVATTMEPTLYNLYTNALLGNDEADKDAITQ